MIADGVCWALRFCSFLALSEDDDPEQQDSKGIRVGCSWEEQEDGKLGWSVRMFEGGLEASALSAQLHGLNKSGNGLTQTAAPTPFHH
jgi:hypothetical protein